MNCFKGTPVILLVFSLLVSLAAFTQESEDLEYRKELVGEVERMVAEMKGKSLSERRAVLRKLHEFIDKESRETRRALRLAEEKAKAPRPELQSEVQRLDRRDTEAVLLELAFENVFEDLLSAKFETDPDFKRRTCENLPGHIRFRGLAGRPEGSELIVYRVKAIDVIELFCSR